MISIYFVTVKEHRCGMVGGFAIFQRNPKVVQKGSKNTKIYQGITAPARLRNT